MKRLMLHLAMGTVLLAGVQGIIEANTVRLNQVNDEWRARLNNSGLPWNDRNALHDLFNSITAYARSGGSDNKAIGNFNKAVGSLQKRISSRSKGAAVRGLDKKQRLTKLYAVLLDLNQDWFDLLSAYAADHTHAMGTVLEQLATFQAGVVALQNQANEELYK